MNVGDLVEYNYGPPEPLGPNHWGSVLGDIGVVVDSCWNGDEDVAEILWFNKYGIQRSYKKYLLLLSETSNG